MRRIIILAAGIGALGVGHASAHAFLKTATPAVGSTVPTSPREVVITFTEGVEPRFSTISVQGPSGVRVETGGVHLAGGDTRLAVGLTALPAGHYTVSWHATSVDTHKTEGRFGFTVAP